MPRRPRIGFHAPIKGGVHNALIVAKEVGCDTVQLFSRNPRGWMAKPLTRADVSLFKQTRQLTKLSPVLIRSEEHTSELQSQSNLVCRLLLEKKNKKKQKIIDRQNHS